MPFLIWWAILLSTVFMCCESYENYTLKIALLDTLNDDTQYGHTYEITGPNKEILAVIDWQGISTEIPDFRHARSFFNQSYDVWLFTNGLCEESNFLETVVPRDFSYNCIGIPPPGQNLPITESCDIQGNIDRNLMEDFCVYTRDELNKVKIMSSVIGDLGWKNMIILYDDKRKFIVQELTAMLDVGIVMYTIDDLKNESDSYKHLLYTIYNMTEYETRNMLLLCSQSCIKTILHQVELFDEVNKGATGFAPFSKWLVFDEDGETTLQDGCQLKIDNLAVVNLPFTGQMFAINQLVKMIKTRINTMMLDGNNMTELIHNTTKRDLTRLSDCWRAEIYTLLYKREGRVLSRVGHVNFTHHVNLYPDVIIFPNTKFGFNQKVFKATTNQWQMFSRRLPSINGSLQYNGYAYDILHVLQAALNFSVVLCEPEDGEWGRVNNGSWTGVVGQLVRREVELLVGPLAMSMERQEVIDYISPFYYAYTGVIFRLPDPNRNKWLKLVEPFKIEVHICLAATFCVISILLYTIEQFNPFYLRSTKVRPTLQATMLYLFGAMLAQGGPRLSASVSGRSLIACWWIFCLISVATYSGNLIASLTVNEKDLPFDTLKQLVSQDEYKWGTVGGTVYITLLSNSNLSDFKGLWKGIVEFNRTDPEILNPDSYEHKHKVMTEDYGLISDVPTGHLWMMDSCQFTMLKEKFVPMGYAYAVQKGSPYAKYFSEETMKIMESGLALILQRNWWPDPGTCQEKSTSSKVIELLDIQSAFYVVLIGVVVATVTILIESCFVKNGPIIKCRLPCFGKISSEN